MKRVAFFVLGASTLFLSFLVKAQDSIVIDSLHKRLDKGISGKQRVDTYNAIAKAYRNQDSARTALYTQNAIELSRKIGYPEGESKAYYLIGWATKIKGHYHESIKLFELALKVAEEASYKKGKAMALNGLGVGHFYLGDFPTALKYHFQSLEISKGRNDKKWMANSYNNIGLIYHYQGDYPSSLECHFKSMKIMEELGNKKGLSDSHSNIGKIYEQQGEYLVALEQYHKSLELREQLVDKIWAANSYRSIGKVYEIIGEYSSALEYHFQSVDIMEDLGDKYGIANAHNFIGEVYLKLKDYPSALRHQKLALNLYNEINAKAYATVPLLDMGKILLATQQYDDAILYLQKATEHAKEVGRSDIIRDGAEQLSLAYEQTGNYKEAFRNMQLFKTMADSLKNQEITKQITSQAMQYDFDKKEALAKIAQDKKNLEQQQQLQTQKYYTSASIGGALALLIIALLVYSTQRKQKKANHLLAKQKEEIQTQAEELKAYDQMVSHDLKGPIAAIVQWVELLSENLNETISEENKQILDRIEKQCKKSISLIHGILDFASAEKSVKFESNVDINSIVNEVRSAYSSTIQEKNAVIRHSELPKVQNAVPVKVYQLLYNLIGNALKFQQPNTQPEIKIYDLGNSGFVIEDNGIGFDKSRSSDIFKPLTRLTNQFEGHGIGLGTCKRIVDIHGWDIAVDSEVGKGTKFVITF